MSNPPASTNNALAAYEVESADVIKLILQFCKENHLLQTLSTLQAGTYQPFPTHPPTHLLLLSSSTHPLTVPPKAKKATKPTHPLYSQRPRWR